MRVFAIACILMLPAVAAGPIDISDPTDPKVTPPEPADPTPRLCNDPDGPAVYVPIRHERAEPHWITLLAGTSGSLRIGWSGDIDAAHAAVRVNAATYPVAPSEGACGAYLGTPTPENLRVQLLGTTITSPGAAYTVTPTSAGLFQVAAPGTTRDVRADLRSSWSDVHGTWKAAPYAVTAQFEIMPDPTPYVPCLGYNHPICDPEAFAYATLGRL